MNNDYEALITRVAAACKVPRLHVDIGYGSESADGRWSIGVKYKLAWTPGFFEARSFGATLAAAESGIVEKVQRAYAKGSGAPMVDLDSAGRCVHVDGRRVRRVASVHELH